MRDGGGGGEAVYVSLMRAAPSAVGSNGFAGAATPGDAVTLAGGVRKSHTTPSRESARNA